MQNTRCDSNMRNVIERNVTWFRESGIMRPNDGFWGVAERLLLTEGNASVAKVLDTFPFRTCVAPGIIALEHRRPDCNFQTALMFEIAADVLGDPSCAEVANAILAFLFDRSSLYECTAQIPQRGLWQFFQPNRGAQYWLDDNSWVVTMLLMLARRNRPDLRRHAVNTAQALNTFFRQFMDDLDRFGRSYRSIGGPIYGLSLNPHWSGLATMALALAAQHDKETDYLHGITRYYQAHALAGPPSYDAHARRAAAQSGLPWSLSEYAYLTLASSVVAQATRLPEAEHAARVAADILVERQCTDGHFPAEHYEAPASPHLADLIYTQNFATLGLLHAATLFHDDTYRAAARRSLAFLAMIQDTTDSPHLHGCWRGMYDTRKGDWGGGDEYEGGQSSIYSGWTNAPITLAFLFELTGQSLFDAAG